MTTSTTSTNYGYRRIQLEYRVLAPKMEQSAGSGAAAPGTLGDQITALQREIDEARAEVVRLQAINTRKSELMLKSSKEWQERVDMLKSYLAIATAQAAELSVKAREHERLKCEQTKRQQGKTDLGHTVNVLGEIARLQIVATPTANVIAALEEFLSKNAAITGDIFYGAGKELDRMRVLMEQIPKPAPVEAVDSKE